MSEGYIPLDWPSAGHIKFSKVFAQYKEASRLSLSNINLNIPAGVNIGLVGKTGSGKTTLALTLPRIVELCAGEITIDNIDISKVNLQYLRQSIGFIPQVRIYYYYLY